jgi:hypothetical protein
MLYHSAVGGPAEEHVTIGETVVPKVDDVVANGFVVAKRRACGEEYRQRVDQPQGPALHHRERATEVEDSGLTTAALPAQRVLQHVADLGGHDVALERALEIAGVEPDAVVAALVDLPRTRERMPGKPDSFFVAPDDVAATASFLTSQPRSAWTFELEARPFGETW